MIAASLVLLPETPAEVAVAGPVPPGGGATLEEDEGLPEMSGD